jgi:hypothetical protein
MKDKEQLQKLPLPLPVVTNETERKQLIESILNHKFTEESSFGDPLEWQIETRKDRELPFRD